MQRTGTGIWRVATGLALCVALGACAPAPTKAVLKPVARPATMAKPVVVAKPTSEQSAQLRSYLVQVQGAQLSQGLLRQDGGGVDTPYTAAMLARNFEQIALYNEYDSNFRGPGGPSPLRRWETPVRIEVIFGSGVPPSQRQSDSAYIQSYASRLARATGHPIGTSGAPNFIVVIAGEDDRSDALAQAARRVPGISPSSLDALNGMGRDIYCVVAAFGRGTGDNVYSAAVAVIRAENPELLRLSCIHEEIAQGLGLPNDSPAARPSIFNDDDEFALLTRHDEALLRILYDPRLTPGMTADEARPIVRQIARELTGGPV